MKADKLFFSPQSTGLLEPLKSFLDDNCVSEILLNRPGEVFVEKEGQLNRHVIPEYTSNTLAMLFQLIANENAQSLSTKMPILSGSLLDGSRVQLVLPPVARYHTLSIRRKVVHQFTLEDYAKHSFYNQAKSFELEAPVFSQLPESEQCLIHLYQQQQWDPFIRLAIQLKKNIVISGGTSSGKTTFLNACLRQIDLNERIITLEDTREIDIPHSNQVNLLALKATQREILIDMQTLVQCCLRLRPDRIIMGEIRGKEILDFIGASSTGHEGSITSIHANNPRMAFMRMTQLYKQNNVPSMTDADILNELHEVIDIVIQLSKTSSGRKVQSIYYKYGNLKVER